MLAGLRDKRERVMPRRRKPLDLLPPLIAPLPGPEEKRREYAARCLRCAGWPTPRIAAAVGCSRQSVAAWARRGSWCSPAEAETEGWTILGCEAAAGLAMACREGLRSWRERVARGLRDVSLGGVAPVGPRARSVTPVQVRVLGDGGGGQLVQGPTPRPDRGPPSSTGSAAPETDREREVADRAREVASRQQAARLLQPDVLTTHVRLLDATLAQFGKQLMDGKVVVRPSDLPALLRMRNEIAEHARRSSLIIEATEAGATTPRVDRARQRGEDEIEALRKDAEDLGVFLDQLAGRVEPIESEEETEAG